jgi:hypothetical protein
MLYGLNGNGVKVEAEPGESAACPGCHGRLIAKCGEIKIWHWAHESLENSLCEWEPESEWHRDWKRLVIPTACEVRMNNHRADIVGNQGRVIELQHSSIDVNQIMDREEAYGFRMIWLFDCYEAYDGERLSITARDHYYSFRWKWARQHIGWAARPVFLDLGTGDIFWVRKFTVNDQGKCYGWGQMLTYPQFVRRYLSDVLTDEARRRILKEEPGTPVGLYVSVG